MLALQGRIPGLLRVEVGPDCGKVPGNWDLVLSSDFVSLQALEDYQTHPEHEAVKALVLAVREDRAVVDYEV